MRLVPVKSLIAAVLTACAAACVTIDAPVPEPVSAPAVSVPLVVKTERPAALYPGLFETVAMAGLVASKDWVDAEPVAAPAQIMAAWQEAPPADAAALAAFVERWFILPAEAGAAGPIPEGETMRGHIEALWPALTRDATGATDYDSLIALPQAYIVPGGRFREVYYWDAYFTMTGLGPEHAALKQAMVDNFAALIDGYGHVPNANRTYYLSRSQPPFFFAMVGLLTPDDPAHSWARYLPELKAEHGFWMEGADDLEPGTARGRVVRLADGTLLNRYWDDLAAPRDESYADDIATAARSSRPDPIDWRNLRAAAESGWDFSSRWFEGDNLASIETVFIIPPDLNAILHGLETAIAAGCARAGDRACEDEYRALADAREAAMRAQLWNSDIGAYDDYDFVEGALKGNTTAAALYPLFFGLASDAEAAATARMVEATLLAPGGLLTTSRATGEQWDAPNGWAPLHWIAVEGLARYGHRRLAELIAKRWLETVTRTWCETGRLVEKYDVTAPRPGGGGEYPTQDGFGWTNGVTLALMERYQQYLPYGEVTRHAADCAGIVAVAGRQAAAHEAGAGTEILE